MTSRALHTVLVALALLFFASASWAADADTHEGKVVAAANGKLTMTGKDGKTEHTMTVAPDAQISLDGKEAKLADLKKDMPIKVTTKKDDKTVAIKIEAKKG